MKRRRVILGVLATLGLAAVAVAVMLWAREPAPGVTEANARRLRWGTSPDRVEAVLGRPPDGIHAFVDGGQPFESRVWVNGTHRFAVDFNDRVLVSVMCYRDDEGSSYEIPVALSPVDRVRYFLGL